MSEPSLPGKESASSAQRRYIVCVALTVAIGGFLLGFDATVISGVVPFIKSYFSFFVYYA